MIEPTPLAPSVPRGGPSPQRILLVDDNEAVRASLARFLQFHGFDVTEAPDGGSALSELETTRPPFSIVLTDLRLPDVEGLEVAHRAREIHPSTWIGLITGWDLDPSEPEYDDINAVLFKPLDSAGLVAQLRRLE